MPIDNVLFGLPHWGKWIVIEWDNTIHVHRYDPKAKTSGQQGKFEAAGESSVIGKIMSDTPMPKKFKIPDLLKGKQRYLNMNLDVVTDENQDYKEYSFEVFLEEGGLPPSEDEPDYWR